MNQSLSVLTGASAGATEAVVVVPFELVKIRLQDKASAGKYNGMMDVVVKSKFPVCPSWRIAIIADRYPHSGSR